MQWVKDSEAFLIQLTGDLKKYQPLKHEIAVVHARFAGPCFGHSLAVGAHDMGTVNGYLNGRCFTKALSNYNIGEDSQGKSVLTGSNSRDDQARQAFTVAKLEVYLVASRYGRASTDDEENEMF